MGIEGVKSQLGARDTAGSMSKSNGGGPQDFDGQKTGDTVLVRGSSGEIATLPRAKLQAARRFAATDRREISLQGVLQDDT